MHFFLTELTVFSKSIYVYTFLSKTDYETKIRIPKLIHLTPDKKPTNRLIISTCLYIILIKFGFLEKLFKYITIVIIHQAMGTTFQRKKLLTKKNKILH